jgi:hypothetical protein
MKRAKLATAIAMAAFAVTTPVQASTCSCASVPLLGAMQPASPEQNQWFLGTTYEFHDVSDLVAGSSTIPDQTGRERTSQALIVEASRGLSAKWSVSALLSAVEHERRISGVTDKASGLGDGIVMLKYSPMTISVFSANTLSFGAGARVPIGPNDETRDSGLTLPEDLQPSTGAFGGLLWGYYSRALNESRGAQVYVSTSYAFNGENDRNYQFGESWVVNVGSSYQTMSPWGFSLNLLYRNADRDQRASVDIPNTGGEWLDVIPAVQYHVTESMALKASVKLPVHRNLNDALQFTTKYAVRVSLQYLFSR